MPAPESKRVADPDARRLSERVARDERFQPSLGTKAAERISVSSGSVTAGGESFDEVVEWLLGGLIQRVFRRSHAETRWCSGIAKRPRNGREPGAREFYPYSRKRISAGDSMLMST